MDLVGASAGTKAGIITSKHGRVMNIDQWTSCQDKGDTYTHNSLFLFLRLYQLFVPRKKDIHHNAAMACSSTGKDQVQN